MVGLKGMSLVGVKPLWSYPKVDYEMMAQRGARMPVGLMQYECDRDESQTGQPTELSLISHIPYKDIRRISATDVLRVDGWASLLTSTLPRRRYRCDESLWYATIPIKSLGIKNSAKLAINIRSAKERESRGQWVEPKAHLFDEFCMLAEDFADRVNMNFDRLTALLVIDRGLVVAGTGSQDGAPRHVLFSKGLAATVQDGRNGMTFVLESIFDDIDSALSLISDLSKEMSPSFNPSVMDSTPYSTDIATQLKELAKLHSSGALSDDEFQQAKSRLLS